MDTAKQKLTDETPGSNTEHNTHKMGDYQNKTGSNIHWSSESDFRLSSTLGLRISRRTGETKGQNTERATREHEEGKKH